MPGTTETGTAAAPRAPRGMRTFGVLWGTQTLSLFGTFVTQFGINIWLTQERYPLLSQKPALALGLTATAIAFTAPMIVFMPLAGAFADRHDRRRILVAANSASLALTLALVALVATGHLGLWGATLLLALYSLASSFHNAAFDSSIPLVAPPEQLPRANGMMMSSYALAQLFSPAVAAALVGLPALAGSAVHGPATHGGTVFAFAADAVTFAVAAVTIALLRIPRPVVPPRAAATSLWTDVREGFTWIARRRPFVWLVTNGSIANLTFAPLVLLLPLLVRDRMHADWTAHGLSYPAALAAVNVAGGAGGLLGGVIVSVWGRNVRRRPLAMVACIVGLGAGQVVTGLARSVWLGATGMFLGEILIAPLNTLSATLWQSLTPPHILARALATRRFIAQSFFPLGTLVAGWLAVPLEPWIVVTASGALLVFACGAQFANPSLAGLEDRMREAAGRP